MNRTTKIFLTFFSFLTFFLLAVANLNIWLTTVSVIVASISVLLWLEVTDGFYDGFINAVNSDLDASKKHIAALFDYAKKEVIITTGTFAADIYCSVEVFPAIENALKRNIRIVVILNSDRYKKNEVRPTDEKQRKNFDKLWFQLVQNNKIEVCKSEEKILRHVIIVDKLHVRNEERHKTRTGKEKKKIIRRARISYFDKLKAQKYMNDFSIYKEKSIPYQIPESKESC